VAKLAIEKYLHYYQVVHGLPYVALRYANVYGPRQSGVGEAGVVSIFCNRLLANQPITIYGDGGQTRDFVYVADVVAANMRALDTTSTGAYNIATGIETTVQALASGLKIATASSAEVVYAAARPGEQRRSCLSHEKARLILGWQPTYDVARGLDETVVWFKTQLA
jgi:UDP-glucose 4-epimerase